MHLNGFFSQLDTERVFFHFSLSVLLENKTGCMSNRKMNTCLGCRVVREVCVQGFSGLLSVESIFQDTLKRSVKSS